MIINKLKKYKPINPSSRGVVLVDKSSLWKGRSWKSLTTRLCKTGGRNNTGRLTSRCIGGGHRKMYRKIDFKRQKDNMLATIERIEYDPNRTAFIALIKYSDNEYNYILATNDMQIGDIVQSGENAPIKSGNCLPMSNIPLGTMIHNIELVPREGGKIIRTAGRGVILTGKEGGYAILKLPSGETRKISLNCRATIGQISNEDHGKQVLGKAGRTRHLGYRPVNRGIARNPVDHHNGGRTHGGKTFKNANGRISKGMITKTRKKFLHLIITNKRKSKGKRG